VILAICGISYSVAFLANRVAFNTPKVKIEEDADDLLLQLNVDGNGVTRSPPPEKYLVSEPANNEDSKLQYQTLRSANRDDPMNTDRLNKVIIRNKNSTKKQTLKIVFNLRGGENVS
jgi:hypothetical protein